MTKENVPFVNDVRKWLRWWLADYKMEKGHWDFRYVYNETVDHTETPTNEKCCLSSKCHSPTTTTTKKYGITLCFVYICYHHVYT